MDFNDAKQIIGGLYQVIGDSLNNIVKQINLNLNARILDIGTGDGKMAMTLALNGFKVITGEPENDYSRYANRNWQENVKKINVEEYITYLPIDAEKLPYEDDFFDAIFIYGTFHHIKNPKIALMECLRSIKKNGVICIIEPNEIMMEKIKKRNPSHPEIIDPSNYLNNDKIKINTIKEEQLNGYLIKK